MGVLEPSTLTGVEAVVGWWSTGKDQRKATMAEDRLELWIAVAFRHLNDKNERIIHFYFLCRATEREELTTITTVRGTLVLPSYSLEVASCRAMIVLILAKDLLEFLEIFSLSVMELWFCNIYKYSASLFSVIDQKIYPRQHIQSVFPHLKYKNSFWQGSLKKMVTKDIC